ncbi:Slit-like protein 1 protein [Larimichthys crocea]|uniref:Uncharacterized protein n=1 Tax=Larimichthys crocea TaxID=215358 RepID=A0ACD3QZ50_LARCR|nr:Slit-like protein 1 protein [Larimichthys crocea]
MWTLSLQAVVVCVFLQVPGCFPSCIITGSIANCAYQNLRWIPPLPPNITHLYLEMNHIGEINSSSLSGLEELQELDLGAQKVPLVIRNNTFNGQRRLKRLVLNANVGLQSRAKGFCEIVWFAESPPGLLFTYGVHPEGELSRASVLLRGS